MTYDPPPPPRVGAKVYRTVAPGAKPEPYHVRAIVDQDGSRYHVVLRRWSTQKGWQYVVESDAAFFVGLYTTKRPKKSTGAP